MIGDKEEILNLLKFFFNSECDSDKVINDDNSPGLEYDEIKLAIIMSLEAFLRNPSTKELKFPLSFSATEQRLVQMASEKMGLKCYTVKKFKKQSLIVAYKYDILNLYTEPIQLHLTWSSRRLISQLLSTNPVTAKERLDIQLKSDKDIREERFRTTTGKLMGAVPQVPTLCGNISNIKMTSESGDQRNVQQQPSTTSTVLDRESSNSSNSNCNGNNHTVNDNSLSTNSYQQHSIWKMKKEIISALKQEPVVLVFGAAGCGKTTQLAQMIMEDCANCNERCRMICTQPYGLCANASANFVARNRQENIGQTTGYQIRLESKVSPRTLLTFCTNEVLLRTLYGDKSFLKGTTHIIVDEIQERSKYCDLLLTVLKGMLKQYRHLKIILLITTPALQYDIHSLSFYLTKSSYYSRHYSLVNSPLKNDNRNNYIVELVRQYYDICPAIYVRKSTNDIDELFLDDILTMINFTIEPSSKSQQNPIIDIQKQNFEKWFDVWLFKPRLATDPELSLFEMFYKSVPPNSASQSTVNPTTLIHLQPQTASLLSSTSSSSVSASTSTSVSGIMSMGTTAYSTSTPSTATTTITTTNTNQKPSVNMASLYESPASTPTVMDQNQQQQYLNILINSSNYYKQIDCVGIFEDILWTLFSKHDVKDIPPDVFNIYGAEQVGGFLAMKSETSSVNVNYFRLLFNLILQDAVSVNQRHRNSGLSALMICSFRGFQNAVHHLLELGADPCQPLQVSDTIGQAYSAYLRHLINAKVINGCIGQNATLFHCCPQYGSGCTENMALSSSSLSVDLTFSSDQSLYSYDMALLGQHFDIADCLLGRIICSSQHVAHNSMKVKELNSPSHQLLHNSNLLFKILLELIRFLLNKTESGTILVYLPDYSYLTQFKICLLQEADKLSSDVVKFQVYLIHSKMMIQDMNSVLSSLAKDVRKIILSTNIGESCININGVQFVIDSGLETKKVNDPILGSCCYQLSYISKVQVALRASRANSPTNRMCFHLFSQTVYESMTDHKVPEMGTSSLNEVVLQVKLLNQGNVSVKRFLDTVLEPPSSHLITSSVMLLKALEGLDNNEEITELGYHLYDLPIDPRYGRMVLSGVLLKCLDPVLTITCTLTVQDPLAPIKNWRIYREVMEVKRKFAANTYSDHMMYLRIFQFWQKARAEGWENSFCTKNNLHSSVFEGIISIRTRLLGQLRASGFVKARGNGDIRDLNINSENWAVVKAAIASGLGNSYVQYNKTHMILVNGEGSKVTPHYSSVLHNINDPCLISNPPNSTNVFFYNDAFSVPNACNYRSAEYCSQSTNNKTVYINHITMVTPITVALMMPKVNIRLVDVDINTTDDYSLNIIRNGTRSKQDDRSYYKDNNLSSLGDPTLSTNDNTIVHNEGKTDEMKSLNFVSDEEVTQIMQKMRQKWQCFMARKLRNPSKQTTSQDEALLKAIVNVLSLEEQAYGLKQPSGVGARPRPMAPEFCNQLETSVMNSASSSCLSSGDNVSAIVTSVTEDSLVTIAGDHHNNSYQQQQTQQQIQQQQQQSYCQINRPVARTMLPENNVNNADNNDSFNSCGKDMTPSSYNMGNIQMENNAIGEQKNGSKEINNMVSHFFAIKLKNVREMNEILETRTYSGVTGYFKVQIEAILATGSIVYLIFINDTNYSILGFGKVLQVMYPDTKNTKTTEGEEMYLNTLLNNNNIYYSFKLDLNIDKKEDIQDIRAKIAEYLSNMLSVSKMKVPTAISCLPIGNTVNNTNNNSNIDSNTTLSMNPPVLSGNLVLPNSIPSTNQAVSAGNLYLKPNSFHPIMTSVTGQKFLTFSPVQILPTSNI